MCSEQEENDPYDIAYYEANCNAWFNTNLEADKSILAVASGAEGLLITLITAFGTNNVTEMILYMLAMVSFAISIICVINVLSVNSTHIENTITGKQNPQKSTLKTLDKLRDWTFIIGLILFIVIGFSVVLNSIHTKEEIVMVDKDKKPLHENFSFKNSDKLKPTMKSPHKPPENSESTNKSTESKK